MDEVIQGPPLGKLWERGVWGKEKVGEGYVEEKGTLWRERWGKSGQVFNIGIESVYKYISLFV